MVPDIFTFVFICKRLGLDTSVLTAYVGKQDADTLHNINLSIKAGEKIAIVGYNGAGKTTLIKLLLRLYDVSQGQICLNGQDIREYDRKNYNSLFATVFQDYKIFASTIVDNVKMDVAVKSDAEQIEQALVQSGLYLSLIDFQVLLWQTKSICWNKEISLSREIIRN
jgi:ATP-binding cassette subfamily B protein